MMVACGRNDHGQCNLPAFDGGVTCTRVAEDVAMQFCLGAMAWLQLVAVTTSSVEFSTFG